MTLRPCLVCGEPSTSPRCDDCKPAASTQASFRDRGYKTAWDKLSKKARKLQPWCTRCGSSSDLTGDHILPISDYPELAVTIENLQVLCRPCNGKRGNNFTHDDAETVCARLQATYKRHPTKSGRERINAALRATQTRGDTPIGPAQGSGGSRDLRYTPLGDVRELSL
jgi:5-methylcytosine-specific restriction endonuclease McrA